MATMSIDLKPGEKLQVGEAILVFVQKSGQVARFEIEADRSVPVKKLNASPSVRLMAEQGFAIAPT